MEINFVKTRKKTRFLNVEAFCREKGLNSTIVRQLIKGRYPTTTSPSAQKVLQALREEGFLVEEEKVEAGEAA